MKKVKIIILSVLLIFVSIVVIRYNMPHQVKEVSNKDYITNKIKFDYSLLKQDNKASLIMNLNTNQIIYQNNLETPLPVYSVSKVMFLASVSKHMQKNNISFDKKIKVSKLIDKVNTQADFSSANLKAGDVYTIEELFDAIMIPSGNDAAILLAIELFGSHKQAAQQMNSDAKEWKMNQSSFVSSSGLDGKYLNKIGIETIDGKNIMSMKDNIILLKKVSKDYPQIITAGSKTVSYIGKDNNKLNKLESVNKLLDGLSKEDTGTYGLKTGSNIENYSNNIIALKKDKNDQTIVSISLGSKTREVLYQDIINMYNYLDSLEVINLADKIKLNTQVAYNKQDTTYTLKKPYYLYAPKDQDFEFIIKNISDKYNNKLNRLFNLNKDDYVGKIELSNKDLFYDGTPNNLSEVIVKDSIDKKSFLGQVQEFIGLLITK